MYMMYGRKILIILIGLLWMLGACDQHPTASGPGLKVMATTSVVGDIVRQVGGDFISVDILLPLGTDPHSFTPTPKDMSRLADARLVFINGAGLEEFLTPMIESAGGNVRLVDLSASITLRSLDQSDPEDGHGSDPHTWMDPNNVIIWTGKVADALIELDPAHRVDYLQNASRLQNDLVELDLWVQDHVRQIPLERRKLITDHLVFGYFADRYGFEQVGAIIPGFSTLAEPSAQELAHLEDMIVQLDVPALFVGWTTNQNLAERIAQDTGVRIVPLYTHSLSAVGGEAEHRPRHGRSGWMGENWGGGVGGKGFGLWRLWHAVTGETKWNDPENEIVIASGPAVRENRRNP